MTQKLKNMYHFFEALLANIIYGFPAKKLCIIGVTGTDGKTTTVSLIYEILRLAQIRVAKVTTVEAEIHGAKYDLQFHGTTPSAFAVQRFLRESVRAKVTHVALEVSSHGLNQFRVWGIPFYVGVLTNITHEHLDYHGTYEMYTKAKMRLLIGAKVAVINMDDRSFAFFADRLRSKRVITYSLRETKANYTLEKFSFETKLFGEFNKQNCLAAIAVAKELGMNDEVICAALKDFRAPEGREEIVYEKEFTVMIDFAHTPNALGELLSEISKVKQGRIIHLFGAPGKRDPYKRPLMGEASSRYAQVIILTADDPRHEDVYKINQQIRRGISKEFVSVSPDLEKSGAGVGLLFEIPDREEAVRFAIAMANPGDFIVLTGKGHERELYLKDGPEPWDEREIVRDALSRKTF